jgi:hypothetical protein
MVAFSLLGAESAKSGKFYTNLTKTLIFKKRHFIGVF